ncbi:DNA polymerase III subunit chi [Hydrogenophaga sp. PBL-H3]|uniref:DNA polymerase III subunit chi n=1 Tax=Hydrogenophaga sp. PBL-H3 TaxID=434010 RepID=UPI0013200317|nr:DNA polymerase III subunit chi [Hydrogenophaga sp. PBL-H3]QHE76587.1 DNA polymerase III subunit chi [Hydrogenophaga sp. PBL-H3]QHE81011.1 DNA polymerase III subunit chi [Hydrogenophaga sp. PBL-H3]
MPEVAFHFNAPDRLGYACRLLRKAYLRKARLFVWTADADLTRLDNALWTMGAGEFVPHCRADDVDLLKSHSPIQLGHRLPDERGAFILVNLRHDMPDDPAAFSRIIEVVTLDEADRAPARERWRQYKALGLEPLRHDLQLAPTD